MSWVIEALESGDYARLGPSVYGKGHLKRYAGLLGLPEEEVLQQAFANGPSVTATPPAAEPPATAPALRVRASQPSRRPRWLPLAGIGLLLLAVACGYWQRAWFQRMAAHPAAAAAARADGTPARPAESAAAVAATDDAYEPSAGRIDAAGGAPRALPSGARAAAGTPVMAAGEGDPITGTGRARLRLSFSADSWVDVRDATGRRLFAGNGRANSVKTIAGEAPMKVYLGFASGVQLEVNSRVVAIGPQFVAGDVARFEAGADGVLRRDARAATASGPHPRG